MVWEEDDLWYPTVDDVLLIHENIIEEDEESTSGVEAPNRIQFAIDYIREGHYGNVPETVHEKAFHLMRLIASNHWFVDGNKRTALNTTALFYFFNGLELEIGQDLRAMVKLFSVREDLVDRNVGPDHLATRTSIVELEELDKDEQLILGIWALSDVLDQYLDIEEQE